MTQNKDKRRFGDGNWYRHWYAESSAQMVIDKSVRNTMEKKLNKRVRRNEMAFLVKWYWWRLTELQVSGDPVHTCFPFPPPLSLFFTVLFSSPLLGRWMMVIWLRPSECLRKIGWLIKTMLSKRATFSFTFRWVLIIYLLSGVGFFSNLISLSSCACHLVEGGKESIREIEFLTPLEDNSILLHR